MLFFDKEIRDTWEQNESENKKFRKKKICLLDLNMFE